MQQKKIYTPHAPAAIGPYSQAIQVGQFIYTAGQIPLDPTTGEIVGNDIKAQTERVLLNLQAILDSAGSSLQQVIKTTVFLTDMSNFQPMNEIYTFYLGDPAPARSTVVVVELPKKALVEIECVALVAD